MSRAYRISIAESVRRQVELADGVQSTLELLPILAPQRMQEILAGELSAAGFDIQDGVAVRREEDGVDIQVDLKKATVTARIVKQESIEIDEQRTVRVEEEHLEEGTAAHKHKLKQQLERQADQTQKRLQQEVTEQLKKKLLDLQHEIDQLVNRTTAAALKEKAAQLGEIEDISEGADGSLTIKVRV